MSNVLIECERSNVAIELGKNGLNLILGEANIQPRCRYLWEISKEDLDWCDVYIAIRPFAPGSVELAKRVKAAGGFYIAYFDDDLLRTREGVWGCRFRYARRCVEMADVVIGCNPVLLKEYASVSRTGRSAAYDSDIDPAAILPPREPDGIVRFVYAAGKDHVHFYNQYIKPVMNRFLNEYGDRVAFTFMGVAPDISELDRKDRIRLVPLMPLEKYWAFMRENRFDVGLAPLDDTPFCNRKYYNKYFEYSNGASMGLYSNCLPYTMVIRHQENGLLVNNTPEDWYRALCLVAENTQLRDACIACAQQELRTNYSREGIARKFLRDVPEMLEHKKTGTVKFCAPLFRLKLKCFTFADKIYGVAYRLKTVGLKNTVHQIIGRLTNQ